MTRPCVVCRRDFQPTARAIRRGGGITCSFSCRATYAAHCRTENDFVRGPAHYGYKHGWFARVPSSRLPQRAHLKVHRAVRAGTLTKTSCARCGATSDLQGHHADYAKPLEVVWLCGVCHRALHGEEQSA